MSQEAKGDNIKTATDSVEVHFNSTIPTETGHCNNMHMTHNYMPTKCFGCSTAYILTIRWPIPLLMGLCSISRLDTLLNDSLSSSKNYLIINCIVIISITRCDNADRYYTVP